MSFLQSSHCNGKMTCQEGFYQAMTVAQKCVRVCGPNTRNQLKGVAPTATWHSYLIKNLIGSSLSSYTFYWQNYSDPTVDRAGWEAAAVSAGLQPISLDGGAGMSVSPGLQLFMLASTLFALGLYETVGQPNGNPEAWRERITS
jgi:hypothetical protein